MANGLHLSGPLPLRMVLERIAEPAYAELLPGKFRSQQATVMGLAIGGQESNWQHRAQVGGPAKGFHQFERGGGVAGVITHPASRRYAAAVFAIIRRSDTDLATTAQVHAAMAENDLLDWAMARLLLFTDPAPLPVLGDVETAWDYYNRNWKPGKPHRSTWNAHYNAALEAIG